MPKLPQRKAPGPLPSPKRPPVGKGKRRVRVLALGEPRQLSNAKDCVGYIVKTKVGVKADGVDYSFRQGKIVDAFTGEQRTMRIVAYHIELESVILEYVGARDVDWIDTPKE